jgi:hypothetical protein
MYILDSKSVIRIKPTPTKVDIKPLKNILPKIPISIIYSPFYLIDKSLIKQQTITLNPLIATVKSNPKEINLLLDSLTLLIISDGINIIIERRKI